MTNELFIEGSSSGDELHRMGEKEGGETRIYVYIFIQLLYRLIIIDREILKNFYIQYTEYSMAAISYLPYDSRLREIHEQLH